MCTGLHPRQRERVGRCGLQVIKENEPSAAQRRWLVDEKLAEVGGRRRSDDSQTRGAERKKLTRCRDAGEEERKSERQNGRVKWTVGRKQKCGRKTATAVKPAVCGVGFDGWCRVAQPAQSPCGWRPALTLQSDMVKRHVYQRTTPPCRKRPLSSDSSSAGALRRQHEKQTVARLAVTHETDATPWIMAPTGSRRNKKWHAATIKRCLHTRTHARTSTLLWDDALSLRRLITSRTTAASRTQLPLFDCSFRHRGDTGALLTRRAETLLRRLPINGPHQSLRQPRLAHFKSRGSTLQESTAISCDTWRRDKELCGVAKVIQTQIGPRLSHTEVFSY